MGLWEEAAAEMKSGGKGDPWEEAAAEVRAEKAAKTGQSKDPWDDIPDAVPGPGKARDPWDDIPDAEPRRLAPGMVNPSEEWRKEAQSIPGGKQFLIGIGKGMENVRLGAEQRGAQLLNLFGLVSDQTVKDINAEIAENKRVFAPLAEQKNTVTRPYYDKGEWKMQTSPMGNPAKIGELTGETAALAAVPGGVGGGAVKRAVTAGLAGGFTGLVQPEEDPWKVAQNTLIGTVGGSTVSAAMSGAGKIYNLMTGDIPRSEVGALSKRFRIRTTIGEETGNPLVQKMETWLEGVPIIGLKGFREKQQKEAEDASRRFLGRFIVDPSAPDIMTANRRYASSLYDDLSQTIKGLENQEITAGETNRAAESLLKRYPSIFQKFQDTQRESIVKSAAKDTALSKDPYAKLSDLYGWGYVPPTEKILTFKEAWELRQGLGEMIGQARKKLAAGEVDKTTYGEISRLYGAVNDDIDTWLAKINRPDVKEAITAANDAYKQYVVKYDIIQRAMDKAEGEVGAGEMFSPKKFSTALKIIAHKDKALNKFSASEINEMTGLANILQAAKRAGQYAENPPTGNRWGIPFAIAETLGYFAKGTVGGLATGTGIISGTVLARFLTGTEAGKRICLTASKVEPDSRAMSGIFNQIYNQLPKAAALGAEMSDQIRADNAALSSQVPQPRQSSGPAQSNPQQSFKIGGAYNGKKISDIGRQDGTPVMLRLEDGSEVDLQ